MATSPESNPGFVDGRRVQSPLRHALLPIARWWRKQIPWLKLHEFAGYVIKELLT